MRKFLIVLSLLCLILTACKKVVQKIPIDACTIPAHTENRVWYSYQTIGKTHIPIPHYYTVNIPITYRLCYRVIYDNDKESVRWEIAGKDEYDKYVEDQKNADE